MGLESKVVSVRLPIRVTEALFGLSLGQVGPGPEGGNELSRAGTAARRRRLQVRLIRGAHRGRIMVPFDWCIVALVVGLAIFGARRGFLWQVAHVGAWFAGAGMVYVYGATAKQLVPLSPPWNSLVAYAGLYMIGALFVFVAANGLRGILKRFGLEPLEKHLGLVWGLAQGCVVAAVLTVALVHVLPPEDGGLRVRASLTAQAVSQAVQRLEPALPKEYRIHLERLAWALRSLRQPAVDPAGTFDQDPQVSATPLRRWFSSLLPSRPQPDSPR
jgi:uncharacterized membrane protein required for colicin V production